MWRIDGFPNEKCIVIIIKEYKDWTRVVVMQKRQLDKLQLRFQD